ncbi:transcriptional regulator [Planctomonas sp. JC2975]|uniref:helix-turn-helix transcriptional regulator n=1 Tax=Planctomonas sp. JC2975 TaxID=2729626 RepID=UPI0014732186|nr:helix-turn-helix domain-containing protein [Planctomonas sp. JC2975]NNC11554.1 transcriptional regulator [Planctomonas sp. JC2975]
MTARKESEASGWHASSAESAAAAVALEPAARRRVLEVLAGAEHPLDAHAIAEALGVHVTTARFHLDQLVASDLVQRRAVQENRRGRPRMLYSPGGALRATEARERLLGVLVHAIGGQDAGGDGASAAKPSRRSAAARASTEAGRNWADSVETSAEADSVASLVEVLDSWGFEPELAGDDILMRGCPFRDLARERPDVVCSVHRGLVERMLERFDDRHRAGARLIPFVEPDLCMVSLGAREAGANPAHR